MTKSKKKFYYVPAPIPAAVCATSLGEAVEIYLSVVVNEQQASDLGPQLKVNTHEDDQLILSKMLLWGYNETLDEAKTDLEAAKNDEAFSVLVFDEADLDNPEDHNLDQEV